MYSLSQPAVPLVLGKITSTVKVKVGKINLSYEGLNLADVPYWWVKNLTFGEFRFAMTRRADSEGLKSNVVMDKWLLYASCPHSDSSGTSY